MRMRSWHLHEHKRVTFDVSTVRRCWGLHSCISGELVVVSVGCILMFLHDDSTEKHMQSA